MSSRPYLALVPALVLLLETVGPALIPPPPPPDSAVITIVASDFRFVAPSRVPAGLVTFRMINRGTELHHVQLIRLTEGRTLADLTRALRASQGPLPAWAEHVGGPGTVAPGDSSEVLVPLGPGRYALICYIPGHDGVAHNVKGMRRELTVTGREGAAPALPAADVVMKLKDYGFELSKPLRAGRQTVRVENEAAQVHEVVLVQLAAGKTAHEFVEWVETGGHGPPPARLVTGVLGLQRGLANLMTADLAPGEYGLVCFFPDAGDGKPHVAHGMVEQITVR